MIRKVFILSFLFLAYTAVKSQTLAERLGYKAEDKLLIITADDAGMCNAVNEAIILILQKNLVTSTSVMIPCPWSPDIIEFSKRNTQYSFGVQLTLTSEYKNKYTWKAINSEEKTPGLYNEKGMMQSDMLSLSKNATLSEIETELRSQIKRAYSLGLNPCFLNSHMFILLYNEDYFNIYVKLAEEFNLPIRFVGLPDFQGNDTDKWKKTLELKGILHPDYTIWNELDSIKNPNDFPAVMENVLKNLKPGVTELYIHPSIYSPEIRNLTTNYLRRVIEMDWTESPELQSLINNLNIKIISYKDLFNLQQKK